MKRNQMTDREARAQIAAVTSDKTAQGFYDAYRTVDNLTPQQAAEKVVRMATGNYPAGS